MESTDVIILLPLPSFGQSEDFRNWVSIVDDAHTVQIRTEEEFTEKLISVIQNEDGFVFEVFDNDGDDDNDEHEEATPSAEEMREYFRQFALRPFKIGFQKMDMFSAVKAEVHNNLRKTFPTRQISLHRFFMR